MLTDNEYMNLASDWRDRQADEYYDNLDKEEEETTSDIIDEIIYQNKELYFDEIYDMFTIDEINMMEVEEVLEKLKESIFDTQLDFFEDEPEVVETYYKTIEKIDEILAS